MTLYGLGTATVDLRITTADLGSDYRAKLLARTTEVFGGGAAANALCQAAALGGRVEWLGRLGDDTVGTMIRSDLDSCRIGTSHTVTVTGALSPFNLAVYAGANRRRVGGFLMPNCLAEVTDADIAKWTDCLADGDLCLVEIGEIPLQRVLDFCRAAARGRSGVTVVGAGDAFHGGFAWALMQGRSLAEAVQVAAICGTANCRAFGARTGMIDGAGLEYALANGTD